MSVMTDSSEGGSAAGGGEVDGDRPDDGKYT